MYNFLTRLKTDQALIPAAVFFFVLFYHCAAFAQTYDSETILTISGGDYNRQFGCAVSIDGDFALVGAEADGNNGSVFVYQLVYSSWVKEAKLSAGDASTGQNFFGRSVALKGNIAVIGSPATDETDHTGQAYIYRYDGSKWTEIQKIRNNISNDRLAEALDFDGERIILSAPAENGGKGAVYIYRYDDSLWVKEQRLDPAVTEGTFGTAVAIDSSTAMVTKDGDTSRVYIYEYDGINWNRKQIIENISVSFTSAAIDDNRAVVSASAVNAGMVLEKRDTSWTAVYNLPRAGFSSAIEKNKVIIGNSRTETAWIYLEKDSVWIEKQIASSEPAGGSGYGKSVAMENNWILTGADFAASTGKAYLFTLIARPYISNISNGEFSDRCKISWGIYSSRAEGFKIFRDGKEITSTAARARAYYDYDATPGKIHNYSVMAFNNSLGYESPKNNRLGWIKTNGKMKGTVQTPFGAGIDSIKMNISSGQSHIGAAMRFRGGNDFVIIHRYNSFPDKTLTISFWIKTTDTGITHPFSFATMAIDNSFLIANPGNINIRINNRKTGNTNVSVNDGQWHHLAVTWSSSDNGELQIIKDGIIVFTTNLEAGNFISNYGSLVFGQDQDFMGGGFEPSQAFSGLLDEVRIWEKVRTPEDIQTDMYKKLSGDEGGLVSYYTFDDLPDRTPQGKTGDYANAGGRHGLVNGARYSDDVSPVQGEIYTDGNGMFSIDHLYYGKEAVFDIIPYKRGHHFDPGKLTIEVNSDASVYNSLSFIDTTALTIIGKIRYAGSNCSVKGAAIFLDGEPTGKFTDSRGEFKIPIDQPGLYDVQPVFGYDSTAHTFNPSHIRVDVEKSILGLQFSDTTRRLLHGKFSAACNTVIGSAQFVISGIENNKDCFKDTIKTDDSGNFSVRLPAQAYKIDLISIDLSDPNLLTSDVLHYFSADTVDLTWTDKTYNFVYRDPPVIYVEGWPAKGGGDYNIPIMKQGKQYDLKIEIFDFYGDDSCHVNQGSVTIYDALGDKDSQPQIIPLINGTAFYTCLPRTPNILSGGDHPYQKSFNITAHIGEETVTYSQWALVTGERLRSSEFITVPMPEIALWVLNDPPGDQSYSFFAKDSTYTRTLKSSKSVKTAIGGFADVQVGVIASFGWSAGLGAETTWSTDFGIYALADISAVAGDRNEDEVVTNISFTATQEFRTSDSDKIIGEEGDVYIGTSLNDEFALADMLKFDWTANKPDIDTVLVYLRTKFGTDFIYTESHIMNTLIPKLKELARISAANGNDANASAYRAQAASWEQQVFNHHRLKSDDNRNLKLYKNYSFSAGTYTTNTYTTHPRDTAWQHIDETTFDLEFKAGLGLVLFGCTYEIGVMGSYNTSTLNSDETQLKTSETYGYTLADDDPGDVFSVDVKYQYHRRSDGLTEPFGPPVFNLVSGVSSNPWEKGTQARDGVSMAMNKYEIHNIQPDEPAPFILYLGNTSESSEEREYYLSVIQSSNLDGAVIRVGGVVIEDHLSYTIPAGQQLNATLTVERGPIAYDYENLKIKFYAPGDEENIADTLTFSVHFISPCSNVNLLLPENNWVLNSTDNDTMQFVINEYDLTNPHLQNIKFQYRRIGDAWSTAFRYPKGEISGDFIMEYWNVSHLPDGEYELRAVSDCGEQGVNYSAIASGIIDRSALTVFGTPEPADGVLNLGEDISFSFSGDIDPAFLTGNSAGLMTADDSTIIEVETAAYENKLIITPKTDLAPYEDRLLIVTVSGIRDKSGNVLRKAVSRTIRVNLSPVYWTVPNVDYTVYQDVNDSFTRTLKNGGAQDEAFSIIRRPSWLTPDVISGTIPSSGEQDVTFRVNTQLNVGNYQDSVILSTSYGEEHLLVSLNVLHEPPDWQFDYSNYTYSANITAQLVFDSGLSDDNYDIVSVYAGDELRGKANVQYIPAIDKYLAFITVYSNQTDGEELSFHLWDASEGREYAWLNSGIIFHSATTVGSINTPLIIKSDAVVQTIKLNRGWSWFSLNVSKEDMYIGSLLKSLSPSNGDVIKGQDGFSQYFTNFGWFGTLKELKTGESYRIKLAKADTLGILGAPVDYLQAGLSLAEGWNWIAHLNQKIMDVDEAFMGMSASAGDLIKSQTEYAQFLSSTGTWEGSLKKLIPGQGYIFKSKNAVNFQYPVLGKTAVSYAEIPDWRCDVNKYEYSMGLTAELEFDNLPMNDSTLILAAFSDYECRGISRVQYLPQLDKYVAFLTIYSNKAAGDSITFKLYEPAQDKKRDALDKLAFQSDGQQGSLEAPYVLTAKAIGDELVPYTFYLNQNYPNPFNPKTIIEYGLPNDEKVELTVYNALGQKVATLVNKVQEAHRYKITLDTKKYNMASGIYFYRMKAGSWVNVKKFVFLK